MLLQVSNQSLIHLNIDDSSCCCGHYCAKKLCAIVQNLPVQGNRIQFGRFSLQVFLSAYNIVFVAPLLKFTSLLDIYLRFCHSLFCKCHHHSTMWKLLTFAALNISTSATSAQTLGWTPLGCFYHDPAAQPLRYSAIPSLSTDTTIENCQAACATKNFPIAGVESGYQCWCDTAVQGGATP